MRQSRGEVPVPTARCAGILSIILGILTLPGDVAGAEPTVGASLLLLLLQFLQGQLAVDGLGLDQDAGGALAGPGRLHDAVVGVLRAAHVGVSSGEAAQLGVGVGDEITK